MKVAAAVTSLKAAMARHERHMNGKEPTSKESQMKMMDEMKAALAALEDARGGEPSRAVRGVMGMSK